MYLAASEINATHEHTLRNIQAATNAYLDASERLTNLFLGSSRSALERGLEHLTNPAAAKAALTAPWGETLKSRSSEAIRESWNIFGQTNHALLQAAMAQLQNLDRVLAATLDRAAKDSPVEGAIALTTFRSAIQNVEATLATLAEVAIQSVDVLEEEIAEVATTLETQAEALTETPAAPVLEAPVEQPVASVVAEVSPAPVSATAAAAAKKPAPRRKSSAAKATTV